MEAELLDLLPVAIVCRDLEHRIAHINRAAETLYGWSAPEVRGRTTKDLFCREPHDFEQALREFDAQGEWRGELEQVTRSGLHITVDSYWTTVRNKAGEASGVLTVNIDITERRKLETQLMQAQRLESIGTLAGGIAHDLNNILTPILMSIEFLRSKQSSSEDLASDLDTLEVCAKRGAELVRRLLSFARGEIGHRNTVDPCEVLADVMKICKDTFPKNITLEMHVPTQHPMVVADATQLHQVVANLCINARDAMPQGGTLDVHVERVTIDEVYAGMNLAAKPGPYVLIKVEDSGVGMPQSVVERIFEPFFTTKPAGHGTGLGLATVHAIVRDHKGFIHVYSEVGHGTKFKVYLPEHGVDAPATAVDPERRALPHGDGQWILVVDDEEPIRQIAQRTLDRFGYRALLAENGAEAVSLFAQHRDRIAAVITDMSMPVMDGPSTIIALRAISPRVVIIGSSGLGANGHVARAAGAGVELWLSKPYTAETLLRTLHRALTPA